MRQLLSHLYSTAHQLRCVTVLVRKTVSADMVQRAAVHERQYPVSLNIRYVKLPNCHLQKQQNGPIERDFTTKYQCFQAANSLTY